MPNKRDQDVRNRIRLVVNRGEAGKQSIQPTCHDAEPKPGNLLIRTLALATEILLPRRNCFNTFRGHSFRALYMETTVEQSRLGNNADCGVLVRGRYGPPVTSEKYWYRLMHTLLCQCV